MQAGKTKMPGLAPGIFIWRMIRNSGYRFSDKIMRKTIVKKTGKIPA